MMTIRFAQLTILPIDQLLKRFRFDGVEHRIYLLYFDTCCVFNIAIRNTLMIV